MTQKNEIKIKILIVITVKTIKIIKSSCKKPQKHHQRSKLEKQLNYYYYYYFVLIMKGKKNKD